MVAVRHLGCLKFECFNGHSGKETHFALSYKSSSSGRSVKPLLRYRDCCDFQNGDRRRFGFSKNRNFNGQSVIETNFIKIESVNGCGDMAI